MGDTDTALPVIKVAADKMGSRRIGDDGVDAGALTVAQSSPCWGFAVVGRLAEGQNGPRGARPPAPVASDG